MTPMDRLDIIKLFDKNLSTSVTLTPRSSWRVKLKKPFNLLKVKVIDPDCDYVEGLKIVSYEPVKGGAGVPHYTNPTKLDPDKETKWFDITNMTDDPVTIAEILGEIFQLAGCFEVDP